MAITCYDDVHPGQKTLGEYIDNQPVSGPLNDSESYYTGQQRQWLVTWLRESADKLRLNHWTLRVWHEPPADDLHATVVAIEGRVFASFRFDNVIFDIAPEDARIHLAHELSHVLFEPAAQMVDHDLKGILGDQALGIFQSAFRRQMEFAVDHLAGLLAPTLPLPPWAFRTAEERGKKSNLTAQDQFKREKEREAAAMPAMTLNAPVWQITGNATLDAPDAEQ